MDHPPVGSHGMADQAESLFNAPQELFDAPQEAHLHLSPTVRWEPDPTLNKFTLHSQDLLLGVLLRAAPNFCTEAVCPDAVPFGCQARLCGGLLPALPCR